jgi:hypothetical protein
MCISRKRGKMLSFNDWLTDNCLKSSKQYFSYIEMRDMCVKRGSMTFVCQARFNDFCVSSEVQWLLCVKWGSMTFVCQARFNDFCVKWGSMTFVCQARFNDFWLPQEKYGELSRTNNFVFCSGFQAPSLFRNLQKRSLTCSERHPLQTLYHLWSSPQNEHHSHGPRPVKLCSDQ